MLTRVLPANPADGVLTYTSFSEDEEVLGFPSPPTSSFIITEDGNFIITEVTLELMITE